MISLHSAGKTTKYFLFWQEENRWVKTWVKSESVGENVREKFGIFLTYYEKGRKRLLFKDGHFY